MHKFTSPIYFHANAHNRSSFIIFPSISNYIELSKLQASVFFLKSVDVPLYYFSLQQCHGNHFKRTYFISLDNTSLRLNIMMKLKSFTPCSPTWDNICTSTMNNIMNNNNKHLKKQFSHLINTGCNWGETFSPSCSGKMSTSLWRVAEHHLKYCALLTSVARFDI